jgi:hypothetical protein
MQIHAKATKYYYFFQFSLISWSFVLEWIRVSCFLFAWLDTGKNTWKFWYLGFHGKFQVQFVSLFWVSGSWLFGWYTIFLIRGFESRNDYYVVFHNVFFFKSTIQRYFNFKMVENKKKISRNCNFFWLLIELTLGCEISRRLQHCWDWNLFCIKIGRFENLVFKKNCEIWNFPEFNVLFKIQLEISWISQQQFGWEKPNNK